MENIQINIDCRSWVRLFFKILYRFFICWIAVPAILIFGLFIIEVFATGSLVEVLNSLLLNHPEKPISDTDTKAIVILWHFVGFLALGISFFMNDLLITINDPE